MITISRLQIGYAEQPVGVTGVPAFSWEYMSKRRGGLQTAYELEAAEDAAFENCVFKKQEKSADSLYHRYEELKLKSLKRYYVRVRIQDDAGDWSEWKTTSFATGVMTEKEWLGSFMTAELPAKPEQSAGTLLRDFFTIEKPVAEAYLCASALGLYQLWMDGKRVGDAELAPGWTSYHKHLCYQVHDVTEALAEQGEHCVGAHVGAGWYKGEMGFLHLRNNYGDRTAWRYLLKVRYTDGTEQSFFSGPGVTGAPSPVLFSEIYDGEIYDASKEIPNWCQVSGKLQPAFYAAEAVSFDDAVFASMPSSRVKRQEHFPAKLMRTPKGELVADFGQNMAGWVRVRLRDTKQGDCLKLRLFETLDAQGNVYTENLRRAKTTLTYYCKGDAEEWAEPHFTYMGFRYAQILMQPGELAEEDISADALYSDMERIGTFSCSRKDLNQLFHNITWSLRSNFVDVPTDCPQRDERMGWTGDAQIFCRTASYIYHTGDFFGKWLKDVACDQTAEGGVPHVVPDIITPNIGKQSDWLLDNGTHSAAGWADVAVLNPWQLYLCYADAQILRDQYESMKAWVDFMEAHAEDGIWRYQLQFGDWVALDAEKGSYFGATPEELTSTAYFAYTAGVFAKIAAILNKEADAQYYGKLAAYEREVFVKHFFDAQTGGMTVQTQTAHVLALYFGLTPEAYRKKTAEELVELLKEQNGHLVTGFMGTPYITHALSENGYLKEAYELLLKEDFPSWLYQVKQGATTIWEHWDGLKPDGTMWSADMNSFNHYAYGAIGEWLVRVLLGINLTEQEPGYRHAVICPRPGGTVTSANGSLHTPYGVLSCTWKAEQISEDSVLQLHLELPAGTTAEVILPEAEAILEADGLNFTNGEAAPLCAKAVSGVYHIRAVLKKNTYERGILSEQEET